MELDEEEGEKKEGGTKKLSMKKEVVKRVPKPVKLNSRGQISSKKQRKRFMTNGNGIMFTMKDVKNAGKNKLKKKLKMNGNCAASKIQTENVITWFK